MNEPTLVPDLSPDGDPWLLTPGPLTTSPTVKRAMLRDYGSRDDTFIRINADLRRRLVDIIHGGEAFTAVPLQGSGTFVVEAMVSTFVPPAGKALVLINGAYGRRIAKICEYQGREFVVQECPEDQPVEISELDNRLRADRFITHVVAVHCETTSGVLNPIEAVADICAHHERGLLIDSMSAFGALPLDSREVRFDAVVASSNKCLEGVPGMGFCLARRRALEGAEGNCGSLSLDLHDQWRSMEANGQWRFTPPTHCIIAFDQALDEFDDEGGVAGRGGRYRENCQILVEGMREMGFMTLLPDEIQAPIIVTFHVPGDPAFDFEQFYDRLKQKGFVIYPGKLTVAESFRIGCIGRLGAAQMRAALQAIRETLIELGVSSGAPATA